MAGGARASPSLASIRAQAEGSAEARQQGRRLGVIGKPLRVLRAVRGARRASGVDVAGADLLTSVPSLLSGLVRLHLPCPL